MKKLAFFVEGQSEQLFIEWLLKEIAGIRKVSVTKRKMEGGRKKDRSFTEIFAEDRTARYFILIVDSGGDARVKSDILDAYPSLSKVGYEKIIGIRDVYPSVSCSEVFRLRDGLAKGMPTVKPDVLFILAIMEFEVWLMSEYTHFSKIHNGITLDRIKQMLGIDVICDDLSQRENPSKDLSDIYHLENIFYEKSGKQMTETILPVLDYDHLKNIVSQKFMDFRLLCQEIDQFFQS